jgi:hypothetical protein
MLNTPPFLLLACLGFWGWFCGFFVPALIMGTMLELSRFTTWRLQFATPDYNRVWDLCVLLFVGSAFYLYATEDVRNSAFAFASWQPFLFFPIILVQAFGSEERLDVRTFSWFLRRQKSQKSVRLNIAYLYFSLCLISAASTNVGGNLFYVLLCAMVVWALFDVRPARFHPAVWALFAAAVMVGGFYGQRGLLFVQASLDSAMARWISSWARREIVGQEARTRIGRPGRVQLSGKVVYRLRSEPGQLPPTYLRENSYNSYNRGVWYAITKDFDQVPVDTNDVWQLLPHAGEGKKVTLARYLKGGKGILALPLGTFRLESLPVNVLETNRMGTVQVGEGPGFVEFKALFSQGLTFDDPPNHHDLPYNIPREEEAVLDGLIEELGLKEMSAEEKLKTVSKFFNDPFSYSLDITSEHVARRRSESALAIFLLKVRKGHCEYFASATALLLRRAGLPARYVTGYAVQESAADDKTYLVRERHAHAWTVVYHNGTWHNFDTTPAVALTAPEGQSIKEKLSDKLGHVWYLFSKWRWGKTNFKQLLVYLLIPLVGYLLWRIVLRRRSTVRREGKGKARSEWDLPGLDSEFYKIEERLAKRGLGRQEEESWNEWLQRVERSGQVNTGRLRPLCHLHRRYRFDPAGISTLERDRLKLETEEWLRRN